ncbi:hypothetical protein ACFSYH_11870 [Populibacterium corticicola]|uniref:Lipoprotein n=1 Tax=Populibacterium corticicola TaxID=1812826 RepID=A0ABW5XH02_9MICO
MHIQNRYEQFHVRRRLIALFIAGLTLLGACTSSDEKVTAPEKLIGLSVFQAQQERPEDEAFLTYDLSPAVLNKEPTYSGDLDDARDFVVLAACHEEGGFAVLAVPEVDGHALVEEAKKGVFQKYLHCLEGAG